MGSARWRGDRRFWLQPSPHVVIAYDGRLLAWNPAWERAFGAPPETADQARMLGDILHPDERARVDGELGRLSRGEEALAWAARVMSAGGVERFAEWNAVALPEEDGGAVMAVVIDITDRQVAIEQSLEKERFLETLMANLPGMVYRCLNDPQWTMVFVSAGTELLTGYSAEELLFNTAASFADLILPEEQPRVWEKVQEAVAREEPYDLRYRIRTKNGPLKWVQENGRGIFADTGELLGLEGFIIDVSEGVLAQEELVEKLRIIEAQRDAIRSLSTPIIEVWEGVLTLPIVGLVDSARAAEITQSLLAAVVQKRCRCAILDLTGVDSLDTSTADHILKMVQAVELLGARGVLVGIRPEVAHALVTLGVDLSRIVTLSNLRQALFASVVGWASGPSK